MTAPAMTLSDVQQAALIRKLTALADDEIILAQRGGEWTGHAPILEEDIALANIAQDELGHAGLYLELRRALDGSDADALAFTRSADEFTSARFVELPKGDWAFTMLRQYLYDAYEALWLDAARKSVYEPLAEVANKAFREERFHLQHTALWVERLALGTPESMKRTQDALNALWPYVGQLWQPVEGEGGLIEAGLLPDLNAVKTRWEGLIVPHLTVQCGLILPPGGAEQPGRDTHTEDLAPLLDEMQRVYRAHPDTPYW
ncbi:1,2-phenylacetyl-CoA epoxidase subunit PaaC [Deinococcus marmoris]|uniref:Phenylacetate-CoA oxygenase, PaaI subunit n=1 Tax=Deinococcus marmoris TaxID=249408 RepID=A0A1U7P3V6_9DEIO|nr:1,2-phenylacetyl-CoA epoxidase subunit PaaC [Deinococcus marmoris]OLV19846.1 Phenylacetate-CoA oxygenase, PaaI subunit [Deinococcus marmoris]